MSARIGEDQVQRGKGVVKDKVVVIVDDSIVRGTTSKQLVQLIRQAGPKEVHFRITSPPIMYRATTAWTSRRRRNLSRISAARIEKIAEGMRLTARYLSHRRSSDIGSALIRDKFLRRREVHAVVARVHDGRRRNPEMDFLRSGLTNKLDELLRGRPRTIESSTMTTTLSLQRPLPR